MPGESQTEQNRMDIVGLKKDVDMLSRIFEKLDQTLDKLEDVIATVSTAIKLHDQKFEYQEKADKWLGEQITGLETKILTEIAKLSLPKIHRNGNGNWYDMQIKDIKPIRWMILGGVATFAWLVSHLDMVKIFEFFQNQSQLANLPTAAHEHLHTVFPAAITPDTSHKN